MKRKAPPGGADASAADLTRPASGESSPPPGTAISATSAAPILPAASLTRVAAEPAGSPGRAVAARNLAHYDSPENTAAYVLEEGLRPLEAQLVGEFFPPPPARVLDLGCGAGRTTFALAELGYQVTGADLSRTLLARAAERSPVVPLACLDASRLPFPDGTFETALFSYNGLDEIYPESERKRTLAEVRRVLRPGGIFLFSSHNLVGTLWSGGYFYLRGYRHALQLLAAQLANRRAFSGYLRYPSAGGDLLLYSAWPRATERQLAGAGFERLATVGTAREFPRGRTLRRSQHVHFVARRPR